MSAKTLERPRRFDVEEVEPQFGPSLRWQCPYPDGPEEQEKWVRAMNWLTAGEMIDARTFAEKLRVKSAWLSEWAARIEKGFT